MMTMIYLLPLSLREADLNLSMKGNDLYEKKY